MILLNRYNMIPLFDIPLDNINSSTFQKNKIEYVLDIKSITTLSERPLVYNFTPEISLREPINQTFTTVQIHERDSAIISELEPDRDTYTSDFEVSIPLTVQKSFFVKANIKSISKFVSKPFVD